MIFKRLKKSTPEQEKEFADMLEEEKVGWKDKFAMIVSAYLVLLLPCILILLILVAVSLWLFGLL